MADKVTLDLHREGCQRTGGYTLLIGKVNEAGYGHGYRLFGPKICLLGNDQHLKTYELDERDAREIFSYIRPLLGDEWLAEETSTAGAPTPPVPVPAVGPSVEDGTPTPSTDPAGEGPGSAASPSPAGPLSTAGAPTPPVPVPAVGFSAPDPSSSQPPLDRGRS